MGKRARKKGDSTKKSSERDTTDKRTYLDPTNRDFIYDAADNDYNESKLGSSFKLVNKDYKKEQVLGLASSPDDDSINGLKSDEEFFMSDSDIIDEDNEEPNDDRNWGKNKKHYYGTDLTDERIYNEARSKGKDKSERLRLELEGVEHYQRRMAEELEDLTFTMPPTSADLLSQEHISKAEERETPKTIYTELKDKTYEVQLILEPLMGLLKKGVLPESAFSKYLSTKYQLALNYLCVLSTYMMIHSSDEDVENHPINRRISQYKCLFTEMEMRDEKFALQIKEYLQMVESGKLNLKKSKKSRREEAIQSTEEIMEHEAFDEAENIISDNDDDANDIVKEDDTQASNSKRLITSEMIKNKGLIPHRRKDQKNPRVKYKVKYRNKLKRRKGQVREVRHELNRYQGEVSGIKANLVKSIILK